MFSKTIQHGCKTSQIIMQTADYELHILVAFCAINPCNKATLQH